MRQGSSSESNNAPARESAAGSSSRWPRTALWLIGGIFAIALAWLLRSAAALTLPLTAALLIALALAPICHWVQRRVPRSLHWLGYAAAMLIFVAILALFIGGLALAVQQVVSGADKVVPQLQRQFENSGLSQLLGGQDLGSLIQNIGGQALTALNKAWQLIAGLILIFFFVLLMLIEGPDWRAKLRTASGRQGAREWEDAGTAIGQQFRRYIVARLLLGAITGALYAGWLALFGIDFLLVWALLAFLLNMVPTVGSIIAGLLPVLFAYATRDAATATMVAAGLLVIEQIMGNYVDPRLLGKRLSISPMVVFASLLFWAWVWGPAGAFIAAPTTVLLIILLAHIPALKPVALYLSNERDMAGLDEKTSPNREGGE